MTTHKILVATTNPGKVAELRAMLDIDVELVGLSDFEGIGEVEEDGATFAENARKKATGYAKATGLWTIADDSGLVIDALDGAPGLRSARFSGEKENDRKLLDHKNMARVLELLDGCLCLTSPEKVLIETQGKLEGVITEKESGTNGFGYDPIFLVPDLNKTVAQLTPEEKNAISHRGNAIRKLIPILKDLLHR
ncbi:MAG: RdgB/HAM1 family non-canonical purine NTP pyrophosphatase [Planctomycetota bacterium]